MYRKKSNNKDITLNQCTLLWKIKRGYVVFSWYYTHLTEDAKNNDHTKSIFFSIQTPKYLYFGWVKRAKPRDEFWQSVRTSLILLLCKLKKL